jgi:hypothetical protein
MSQTDADARYVNTSGDSMTGALIIKNGAGLNASGAVLTNGNLSLNSDNGAVDAVLTFGNSVGSQTVTFNAASQRFDFSKEIHTSGGVTASGGLVVHGLANFQSGVTISRLMTGSKATLLSVDQLAIGQLEGGAVMGRVGVTENQWRLNNYGQNWVARESSRNWYGIAVSSDGKYQTAVVFTGQIYTSSDYGKTWTARNSVRSWREIAMSADGKFQTATVNGGQIYTSGD